MALNFAISYTFSSGTTISSSQVNTNTSDVANVFTGLEAGTKTLAFLKMDAVPATTLEVATKGYVDRANGYRRAVPQFGSTTTVAIESGLDGTSGDIPLLFPDGSIRTETSTTRTTFNITRNVVLTTSGAQSGLTGATSEANNTWYALLGAKVTDSSTLWCTVGTTVIPTQANYATLNTAYGTSGWVYFGMTRNGDNSTVAADILDFIQIGNTTYFRNINGTASANLAGIRLANTAGATTLTYTYASGTGAAQIPAHIGAVSYFVDTTTGAAVKSILKTGGGDWLFQSGTNTGLIVYGVWTRAGTVVHSNSAGESEASSICLTAFMDGVLGVGSNPLL